MNLAKLVSTVLTDPAVRGIVLPLAEEVISWVRSGKPAPLWLERAGREVPEIRSGLALARARERVR